jgi:murein L,D-transpeptidase YcbB/YkuD
MYWTARVSDDGTVQFRPDVYGRDTREMGTVWTTLRAHVRRVSSRTWNQP